MKDLLISIFVSIWMVALTFFMLLLLADMQHKISIQKDRIDNLYKVIQVNHANTY